MYRLELRLPPPFLFLLAAIAMWLTARLLPMPLPPGPAAVARWAQWLPAAAGAGLGILAVLGFRQARTTVHPQRPAEASALVTGGVYRLTRNPMYLGLALLPAAWALRLGQLLPWLWLPAFMAWITRFQIIPEERALAAGFGADWQAFRRRTRRWL